MTNRQIQRLKKKYLAEGYKMAKRRYIAESSYKDVLSNPREALSTQDYNEIVDDLITIIPEICPLKSRRSNLKSFEKWANKVSAPNFFYRMSRYIPDYASFDKLCDTYNISEEEALDVYNEIFNNELNNILNHFNKYGSSIKLSDL